MTWAVFDDKHATCFRFVTNTEWILIPVEGAMESERSWSRTNNWAVLEFRCEKTWRTKKQSNPTNHDHRFNSLCGWDVVRRKRGIVKDIWTSVTWHNNERLNCDCTLVAALVLRYVWFFFQCLASCPCILRTFLNIAALFLHHSLRSRHCWCQCNFLNTNFRNFSIHPFLIKRFLSQLKTYRKWRWHQMGKRRFSKERKITFRSIFPLIKILLAPLL